MLLVRNETKCLKEFKRFVFFYDRLIRGIFEGEKKMLYLILAIVSSSLVSIVMRISGKYIKGNLGMLATNYVVCVIMSAFYSGFGNLYPKTDGVGFTLGLGVCTGFLYLAGLALTQLNIKKNGVVLSTIFQKLGLIVQVLLSIIIFGERPKLLQVFGIVICIIAVILINFEKEQTVISFKMGLILTLLVSGFCDGMSKVHEELGNNALSEQFLLYVFGTALILSIILILAKKEPVGVQDIGFGILLGIPNYFSCKFLLKALNTVPAVIAFPTFSVSAVVIVTLAGLLVFKEKLSKKQWIALAIILVALIMLNI